MNKTIRCGIYDRVSTDIQVQTGLSLDAQRKLLTEYAESHGYKIVDYYQDEGITARKKLQNRKDFMRLLNDIENDKIDLVLVTKLDRWFRNVRDYHNTQAILEAHNCNWKTILEDYDTSTADGQLKINIMLAVAQNESDRTSERIKVVFEMKRRNMEHMTGAAPYGYRTVNKKLVKDENTREIVDELFAHYFKYFSKRKARIHIIEKYGDKAPSVYQIGRILKHELYCGLYKGTPGYCEPYITVKQHETIKSISDSKTYTNTLNESYLFSQLMKCPHCDATMTGFVKTQKLRRGGVSRYKRYRCSNKFTDHTGGVCITESVIEEYMLAHLEAELDKNIYLLETQSKMPRNKVDSTPKIRAEIDRLNILFQKGRISDEYYESQYDALNQKLIDAIEENKQPQIEEYKAIKAELPRDWQEVYKALDAEHKRAFWKRIIKEIEIDKDTHKICGFIFLT